MSMPAESRYEHSDAQAERIGAAAFDYIMTGAVDRVPLEFRGVAVFGVVAMLREHDDLFQDDGIEPEQRARLEEIESDIARSLDKKLHYYPFGHNRNRNLDSHDKHARERAGEITVWGTQSRRSLRNRSAHGGEYTAVIPTRD